MKKYEKLFLYFSAKVKNYNLNVTEILHPDFKGTGSGELFFALKYMEF